MRIENPPTIDPWGKIGEDLLRQEKQSRTLRILRRINTAETMGEIISVAAAAAGFATGHLEVTAGGLAAAGAFMLFWADTSGDITRLQRQLLH